MGLKQIFGSASALVILGLASAVQAAPLGLHQAPPDINAGGLNINYIGGHLSIKNNSVGSMYSFATLSGSYVIFNGSFDIEADLTSTGDLKPGGSITIGGTLFDTVASSPVYTGTLLTGNLSAFGFPLVGTTPLEFTFDTTVNNLGSTFVSASGGVIVNPVGLSGLNFAGNFASTSGASYADTFAVPSPAALSGGLGLLGLMAGARRRRTQD